MGEPGPGVRLADGRLTARSHHAPASDQRFVDRRAAESAARRVARQQALDERNVAIRAARQAGESAASIADRLGLHFTTVFAVLRGHSSKPKGRPAGVKSGSNAERDAEWSRRIAAGETTHAIAADHGVHPTLVGKTVRRVAAAAEGAP